jgi:hypothetical protein
MDGTKQQPSPQEVFLAGLEQTVVVVEALAAYAKSTDDLLDVLRLGLANPAQARLLFDKVTAKRK